MFDEATDVDNNPYYATKHESERVVREESTIPWRVYRPGIVVGQLRDRRDRQDRRPVLLLPRHPAAARAVTPSWLRGVGIEGGPINIVPVDYVAKAMDYLAHQPGLDGRAFHLTDPRPMTVGQMANAFAKAAKAPQFAYNVDTKPIESAINVDPEAAAGGRVAAAGRQAGDRSRAGRTGRPARGAALHQLPDQLRLDQDPGGAGRFGHRGAAAVASYAQTLWEYWERTYSPDRRKDRALARAIKGKTVMITGASSGIGRATALRVGAAGGKVILVARGVEKLEQTKTEIEDLGGVAFVHRCDLSDMSDIERMAKEVLQEHGRVDVLVNNAGRSIRRSIALSYDRFHDFERTMQLNYFGAVRLDPHAAAGDAAGRAGRSQGRPDHQHQLDRRADEHAAVLGLRGLEGGARRVLALHRLGGAAGRRAPDDDPHAARAHADDRADDDVRPVPDDDADRGRGHDLQGDDPQAEEGRHAARQLSARWPTRSHRAASTSS